MTVVPPRTTRRPSISIADALFLIRGIVLLGPAGAQGRRAPLLRRRDDHRAQPVDRPGVPGPRQGVAGVTTPQPQVEVPGRSGDRRADVLVLALPRGAADQL